MSGKRNAIIVVTAAFAVFCGLGLVFDRDVCLSPFARTGKGQDQEKARVFETLQFYNAVIADIYATGGNPKMLNDFPATKAVRHNLFRDIGFIRDMDYILVYDLAKMTPVDVRFPSYNTAEAVVFEEWNYQYERKKDRTHLSPVKGMGKGFLYKLVKEKGRWVVYAWEPVPVDDPSLSQTSGVKP